jgi:hypothetical protein
MNAGVQVDDAVDPAGSFDWSEHADAGASVDYGADTEPASEESAAEPFVTAETGAAQFGTAESGTTQSETTAFDTIEQSAEVAEDNAGEVYVAESQFLEAEVAEEYAESQEPDSSDDDHLLARERPTPQALTAAIDDDDWFRDVDDEAVASPLASPTAAIEPALFQGLGDLERLGPAPHPDVATAPANAGAPSWDGDSGERREDGVQGASPTAKPSPAITADSTLSTSDPTRTDLVPQAVNVSEDGELRTGPRATVAEALERVALRIRDGDVALPSDVPSASEEAALAAVLAALLQSRSR